jgi:Virulence activator alpha C-term
VRRKIVRFGLPTGMPTAAQVSANEGVVLGMRRDALGTWLASSELADGPARNPFLVKLYFGALLQPEEIAAHIRERRERIGIELAELEALERTIDRDASPFGFDYAA